MNVTLNNTSQAELSKMVAGLQDAGTVKEAKTGATRETAAGSSVSLSVTLASGRTVTMNVSLPAIDTTQEATYNEADYAELEKAVQSLESDLSGISKTSTCGALADLYAIMALLYETMQKERESTLLARSAEHAATQTSLLNEAADMEQTAIESYNQAMTGAVTQIVMSSLSAVASGVSLGLQIGSYNAAGPSAARTDYNAAAADKKTISSWPKEGANAGNDLALSNETLAPENKQLLGLDDPNSELSQKQNAVTQSKGALDSKTQGLNDAKGKLGDCETTLADKKAALEAADAGHRPDAEKELESAQSAYDAQKATVGRLEGEVDAAKVDYSNKSLEYGSALDKKVGELKAAGNSNAGIENFARDQKATMRGGALSGAEVKYDQARSKYDTAMLTESHSKLQIASKGMDELAKISKMAGDTTASYFNAQSQYTQQMGQSRAKEHEAEQEGHKAQIESYTDMAASQLDLLKFINQTLQAIQQAESQATQSAIRV